MSSKARAVSPMEKCACISKLEMNGEILPGSSGVTAKNGELALLIWESFRSTD
jgi:hypothetical protein